MEIHRKNLIAYYISAHGYGHGVRSCSIIRAINDLYPQLKVQIVSNLPPNFLSNQFTAGRNAVRQESFDIGMVQLDSIRVDVPSTLERIQQLYSTREKRVQQEAEYLKEQRIDVIVADIPAIPIEAAALAGIPRLAVGNFSWDWIYSEFLPQDPRWAAVVDTLREQYAKTDLLLRLPFCDSMNAFPQIADIPLVSSPGRSRRSEIRDRTQADPAKRWILLSFTTLDWSEEALRRVRRLREYEFFSVLPLAWSAGGIHALDPRGMPFPDMMASMDAVISKPGFGILSDCIANRTPLIYADRTDFREYQVLIDAIEKYTRHMHIPASSLYQGDLRECLERIWNRPEPSEVLPLGGAEIAAQRIAGFLQAR